MTRAPACGLASPRLDRQSGPPPRRPAAVEYPDVGHSRCPQQPPGPGRGLSAPVVIDDDRVAGIQAPPAGTALQRLRRRQGVTSPPGHRMIGQLGVEVDVHRAGDMAVAICRAAIGGGDGPTHIEELRGVQPKAVVPVGQLKSIRPWSLLFSDRNRQRLPAPRRSHAFECRPDGPGDRRVLPRKHFRRNPG